MQHQRRRKTRTVVVLALQGVQLLDVSGPLDVFAEANNQVGYAAYSLEVMAVTSGPISSSSGVRLLPDRIIGQDEYEGIDTLLVAGRPHATDLPAGEVVTAWLKRYAPRALRIGL